MLNENLNEILQLINIKIRNDGYYATITDFMLHINLNFSSYCTGSLKNNYTYEKTRIEYGRKYQPVKHYSIDLATLSNANKKYLDAHRNFYVTHQFEFQ